jgi:hypothetical protein
MQFNELFAVVVVATLVTSCGLFDESGPSAASRAALKKVGSERLRSDALLIAKRFGSENSKRTVPITSWTPALQLFKPVQVDLWHDAIFIVTSKKKTHESGVAVYFEVPKDDVNLPESGFVGGGSGMTEYKMADGVHWCWFKNREELYGPPLSQPHTDSRDPQRLVQPSVVSLTTDPNGIRK